MCGMIWVIFLVLRVLCRVEVMVFVVWFMCVYILGVVWVRVVMFVVIVSGLLLSVFVW